MPVIAVVNRKGGSGKSTLAAHLAVWCARQGHSVMLGDVDRQQSSRAWLRRRDPALPHVAPWAMDQKNVLRVPSGITHVVLDTPGGLHGFELARVVMFADAILMPVCHSVFDRESAAACHAELMALPRVASGRCRLATVGMRIDGRTRAGEVLRTWSEELGMPFLGVLRETQLYVRSLEKGLTVFDLAPSLVTADLAQWDPILQWLRPLLTAPVAANDPSPSQPQAAARVGSSRPSSLKPAQDTLIHGSRLSVLTGARPLNPAPPVARPPSLPRAVADGAQIPQFLKR
ncbi:ParA family protein [uncultured Ramlibacter sp.]|uniref:ParA family protein n=1 Tax=uncultured Ramlibacter sp. TaxID=260755 RepID=UPI002607B872|nr:ParA family protein [uncultured Ramlibacter sp.]